MPLNANLCIDDLPDDAASGLVARNVTIKCLKRGDFVFRGASTYHPRKGAVPMVDWVASPWWIEEDQYHRINKKYLDGRSDGFPFESLGFTMRHALAVQQGWSRVDVVVKAWLLQDINVFSGPGRCQFESLPNGMTVEWRGWPLVRQIYIPNVDKARSNDSVVVVDGRPVLRIQKKEEEVIVPI